MAVKIVDNTKQVGNEKIQKASIFLRMAAEEVVKISTPKTPRDTGNLRNNVIKQVLGLKGKVEWKQNYAIYQEKKQYSRYTTAGTGPHYAENAVKEVSNKTDSIAKRVGLI